MIVRALNNHWFERPRSPFALASQFTPFDVFRGELERLFSIPNGSPGPDSYLASQGTPNFDLVDEGHQLKVTSHLPGMAEKDIDIKLTSDRLTMRGERKLSLPEGYRARRRERQSYSFEQSLRLPARIDPDKAEARLANGVLTLTLPKTEAAMPRSIAVRSA